MPPKKATTSKSAPTSTQHASYKDMIKDAILDLKERNGSSRSALKKYILANKQTTASSSAIFDNQFNKALRTGVERGEFVQPKGPSGTVKLAKKEATAKPAEKKETPKKAAATKPAAKKATASKEAAAKKDAAPKKAATKAKSTVAKKAPVTKKATPAKPKANTAVKRKSKAPTAAPAIVEVEKVLGRTKSGRVTKGPARKEITKKPAAKKAATKKATPKKGTTDA